MRILHIVSLITPTGTYGGPVRVAVGQVKALKQLGHDVTLIAGTSGFTGANPTIYDGVAVKLFDTRTIVPGTGFAGITSFHLLAWVTKNASKFDVVHIHLARDLLTMVAASIVKILGIPYVVQTHGMIDPSTKMLSRPLDMILTRPVLRSASRVLYLNDRERKLISQVAGNSLYFLELRNGVESKIRKGRILQDNSSSEILFLSRLDPQKRSLAFVKMGIELHQVYPDTSFSIVGPDEGDGPAVNKLISDHDASSYISWEGPVAPDETEKRMNNATVFVLPSFRDAFPMSVLEAMSLGIPPVVTRSCGIADYLEGSRAGIVVEDDSVSSLVCGVTQLLSNAEVYNSVSCNALNAIRNDFSSDKIAQDLSSFYSSIRADS